MKQTIIVKMWNSLIVIVVQISIVFSRHPLCKKHNGFFVLNNDCRRFYRCFEGELVQNQTCPKGTLFNVKTSVCDFPSAVANTNCRLGTLDTAAAENYENNVEFAEEQTEATSNWRPTIGPTIPMEPLPTEGFNDNYRVVCYFTSWSFYRKEDGKFIPENINPYYCTHIIYAFAKLDREKLTISIHDKWADIENYFYKRIVELKRVNPKLKVLIAIGGWNDSEDDRYSRLVSDPNARAKFIKSTISFLENYGFDGLDVDWEFPGCPQGKCHSETNDKEMFAVFIGELKEAFKKCDYLLTAAVSATKYIIDVSYDVRALNEHFDFVNLMAYDYHGAWSDYAENHSPVFAKPSVLSEESDEKYKNVNFSVTYWIDKGMDPKKIVLGVPIYGRAVALKKKGKEPNFGIGAAVKGPAKPGYFTNEPGFLSYYEICSLVNTGDYAKHRDQYSGSFIENGRELVGYDDVKQVMQKMAMIKHYKLGGAMIWSIDMDDFRGKCCDVKYPLLKTINYALRDVKSFGGINCP